jgi:hypothetical protein
MSKLFGMIAVAGVSPFRFQPTRKKKIAIRSALKSVAARGAGFFWQSSRH